MRDKENITIRIGFLNIRHVGMIETNIVGIQWFPKIHGMIYLRNSGKIAKLLLV